MSLYPKVRYKYQITLYETKNVIGIVENKMFCLINSTIPNIPSKIKMVRNKNKIEVPILIIFDLSSLL